MIDIFTPKRISPHCPFKTNQRFAKISILTARCAFWLSGMMLLRSSTPWWEAHSGAQLCSVMHTAEFFEKFGAVDSAVWYTPRSQAPQWDAHRGASLRGGMHTTELDCQVHQISVFLVFSCSLLLLTTFYKKTSEVKKIPQTICDLQYNFYINIFRHQREIAFVKLRIKTDTW